MADGLKIRTAIDSDIAVITDIYNHYVTSTHITFDLEPVNLENRRGWMEQFDGGSHQLIIGEVGGEVIGYACSGKFRTKPAYDSSVETTIYLSPAHTGAGYGFALYDALHRALEKTDVHRTYAVIALPNDASIQLHKRLGYREVGHLTEVGYKFDKYWDTLWLERRF